MQMKRESLPISVTVAVTAADSTEIPLDGFAGGSFELPATSGTTAVTFYAQVGNEAYGIMNDEDGVPVPAMAVSVSLPYPLPSVSYNYSRMKIVASSGTATPSVPVILKS